MKAVIHTLGCKVNTYESEVVANLLRNNGYDIVSSDDCDLCVINTCTVTNTADSKSRKIINQCIRKNSNAIIVVMGCFSQVKYNEISENKDIDIILGTSNKTMIIDCINEFKLNNKQIVKINTSRNMDFENMKIDNFSNKHRAFIKIQDGCNNFCSYCIIPYTRGTIRCKDYNLVISEVKDLVNNSFKEIVLTGIHTGSYNNNGVDFCGLLKLLVKIPNLERIRISSIEITELHDDFFLLLKNQKIIADHLHIPLQSGSDKILKLMNRKYDTTFYKNVIDKIRMIRKDISITTDVIVGFPGETIDDFLDMYKFIDSISFSSLHVFPYSKRDFTKAALMDNQVNEKEKSSRVNKLITLKERKELEYMTKFISKTVSVLFETYDGDTYIGHSSNYLKVKVKSDTDIIGNILDVKIISIEYPICYGEKIC